MAYTTSNNLKNTLKLKNAIYKLIPIPEEEDNNDLDSWFCGECRNTFIAQEASNALFAGGNNFENAPSLDITQDELKNGISIIDALVKSKLCASNSEARRIVEQGGAILNEEKINDIHRTLNENDFTNNFAILKRGKKLLIKLNLI